MRSFRDRYKKAFSNNFYILKLALKEAPVYTLATILDNALHEIIVFFEHVYMIAYIIDSIQYQRPFTNVLIFVSCIFAVAALVQVWRNYIDGYIKPQSVEKINLAVRMMLFEKASGLDLECYDNPAFYNDFVWSMSEATSRVEKVLSTIARFIGSIAGIIITGIFVLFSNNIGIILAFVAVVVAIYINSKLNRAQIELDEEIRPLQRKRDYVNRVMYLSDYAKELRLSDIKDKLYQDFGETNEKLVGAIKKKTGKMAFLGFINEFITSTFLFDGVYLIYLLYHAIVLKTIGFGTLTALYRSSESLKRNIQSFSIFMKEIEQNSLYIEKIFTFLRYEEKITDRENAKNVSTHTGVLEFKNVSFRYTEDGAKILDHINLKITPGEKISLVGYNGAGKTTLIKLMLRLYEPTEGEILLDGINIKEYKVKQYRELFSAIFQDYQLFAATLLQNVTMSTDTADIPKAIQALQLSELEDKLGQLKNGVDTPLNREFDEDGVNLSGGEAQKVALSRLFYKDSPIIILDEPSSALDPIAEYKVNNSILNLSDRKTVIFISHRLSTTKMAGRIYMLENGKIIEQGTHATLIALNGKYAEMFNLQAEKYR